MSSAFGVSVARGRPSDGRRSHSMIVGPPLAAVAVAASLVALAAGGCHNRSDRVLPSPTGEVTPYPQAFGTAQAIDPTPATSSSQTTFDASRHAVMDAAGNALVLMKADDGTGVLRCYAVRYDAAPAAATPFTSPVAVDAGTGTNVDQAQMALDDAGHGVLVFSQTLLGIRRAYARVWNGTTAQFGPVKLIDSGGSNTLAEDVSNVAVALDAGGNGVLAFSEADDVFGVTYDRAAGTFGAPVQLDTLGNVGNTVSTLRVLDRGGAVVTWLQDADTSGSVRRILTCSRQSTSGSLGLAATVNPDTSTDVAAYTGALLADGALVVAWTQAQSGGGTRVFARRQSTSGSLGLARDLGGSTSGSFDDPAIAADPRATVAAACIALRRLPASGASEAWAIRYAGGAFDTAATRIDTALGSIATGSLRVATDGAGRSEIVFVQGQDATASAPHERVTAVRHEPGVGYGTPRLVDHGAVQTSALVTSPLGFAAPTVTGIAFDASPRAFVTYTQTDGHLTRTYVARTAAASPAFGAPEPADGANRNNLFAAAPITDQVVAGDATFLVNPAGTRGLALSRQRHLDGSINQVRLWANAWNGYNPPAARAQGATLVDGFRDAAAARDTTAAATAVDQAGDGLTVWVQSDGTNPELYWAAWRATGAHGPVASASIDNGTSGVPSSLRVVMDPVSGNAYVLFLQDDGTGRVQLYARYYQKSTGSVVNVAPTGGGANDPVAVTSASAGSVQGLDAVFHPQDGAAYVVIRQVKNTATSAEGVFGLKVTSGLALVGPAEHSTSTATIVSDPKIVLDGAGNALTLWRQGNPPILCARQSTSSSLGMAFTGPPDLVSASTTLACGEFVAMADGFKNFLVAFERTDVTGSTPGLAIVARRRIASTGTWEGLDAVKLSSGLATTTAPALTYGRPVIVAAANGHALVVFRQADDRPAIDTVNLVAVTYDAAAAVWGTPAIIDNGDGAVNNGLDIHPTAYAVAMRASTGVGLVAFVQDADPSAGAKPRAYALGFHLGNLALALPVFDTSATDLSEGGGAATRVTALDLTHDGFNRVWIRFIEEQGGSTEDTRAHLLVRAYDLATRTAGAANAVASRALAQGTGGAGTADEAENVTWSMVAIDGAGAARVLALLAQDANGASPGTTVRRRLFANTVR